MTTNLTLVSKQWASRPSDQRFLTLDDLREKVKARRETSRVSDFAFDLLSVRATEEGGMALTQMDGKSRIGDLTHYTFGQLCSHVGAPSGYLRTLPAELAQIPLAYSMERSNREDVKILVRENGTTTVGAVTSPSYGRIWDAEVVESVQKHFDSNVWKVPYASYQAKDPLRATTLYASDRDVFIFLVSENSIDVDGESIKRGIIVWNSEVGSATLGLMTFTYDRVCDNRIIWNASNVRELRIKHTSGAPHRFAQEAQPLLAAYVNADTAQAAETIKAAKKITVGATRSEVVDWMKSKGFTVKLANSAYDAAENDIRGYNPRTLWGVVQGITDVAHDITHQDARTEIEIKAGKLLEAIAA